MVLVCPEGRGEGLECLEGETINAQLWAPFMGDSCFGEADHVFTDGLHCSRHWRRDTRDKQVLSGGLLLCLGVPGCVVQASLCGCD